MASRTAGDLVKDAARWAQIVADEEAPTASQGVAWLRLLNQMMHAFPSKGIQYAHTDLASADTVNVPDEMLQSVTRMLGAELADDVELTLSNPKLLAADDARRTLQAFYRTKRRAVTDPVLQFWPPGVFSFDRFR